MWIFTGIGLAFAVLFTGGVIWAICQDLWLNFMDSKYWKYQNTKLVTEVNRLKDELKAAEQVCKMHEGIAKMMSLASQSVRDAEAAKNLRRAQESRLVFNPEPLKERVGNPWLPLNCS